MRTTHGPIFIGQLCCFFAQVVGLDKSSGQTQMAQSRNPNVEFFNIDAYDAGAVVRLGRQFTVIYVDVSGSRPPGDVVQLIDTYHILFKPR